MPEESTDQGIIQAVVDRLEKIRLPKALQLQEKVAKGETLNDMDMAFLENVFNDTKRIKGMLDKYPAWQPLYARMISLYNDITTRALENEQGSSNER